MTTMHCSAALTHMAVLQAFPETTDKLSSLLMEKTKLPAFAETASAMPVLREKAELPAFAEIILNVWAKCVSCSSLADIIGLPASAGHVPSKSWGSACELVYPGRYGSTCKETLAKQAPSKSTNLWLQRRPMIGLPPCGARA